MDSHVFQPAQVKTARENNVQTRVNNGTTLDVTIHLIKNPKDSAEREFSARHTYPITIACYWANVNRDEHERCL